MANISIQLIKSNDEGSVYNKAWIKSIESTTQSTTNPSTIEYGILANTGRLEIKDIDGSIRADIESGVLPISNLETLIWSGGQVLQEHITSDSDYSESDNLLSLPLTNKISLYDNIPFSGFPLSSTEKTAYELLMDICGGVGIDESKLLISYDAQTSLKNIKIKYPYIKPCTAREALNKICELAQLQIYAYGKRGYIKIISTNNANSEEKEVYTVPSYYKITNLDRTIVLKNKYDAIDMRETKVIDEIDFDKLYLTQDVVPTGYLTNSKNQSEYNQERLNTSAGANAVFVWGKTYVVSYYSNIGTITIPKKKNENKEQLIKLLSGVDSNGNPNIKYSVTYTKKSGTVSKPDYSPPPSSINDFVFSSATTTQETGEIPTSFTYQREGISKTTTIAFNNLSNNFTSDAVAEDERNYYVSLLLLVGARYVGASYYSDVQDSYCEGTQGDYEEYIPLSASISFYGNVREISFEDVDVSSANIKTAKNPVTIPHNELLQDSATWNGEKLSTKIKNNVLEDYKNGVPTGKIELFCGDLVSNYGTIKQWKSGETLEVDDVITFADDPKKINWQITGRTFTYNASPKLSLELKLKNIPDQREWKSVWEGFIECPFPTTSGKTPVEDGYYYATQTTYINLDDYGITRTDVPIRISGAGNYGGTLLPKGYDYYIEGIELYFSSKIIQENAGPLFYGRAMASYNKTNNTIEITMTGRSTQPSATVAQGLTFTLTKIEQYY